MKIKSKLPFDPLLLKMKILNLIIIMYCVKFLILIKSFITKSKVSKSENFLMIFNKIL